MIEVFAGTARLTLAVRDIGLSGLAVDKTAPCTLQTTT